MNTVENNKLIAEFMGAQSNKDGEYEMYGIIESIDDGEDEQHFFASYDMKFHTDWNWLMQVVGKISEVAAGGITYDVHNTLLVADIEKTYNAVVAFIKWYNLRLGRS